MSKDLEVLLRATYLGAIMMMVSRNMLKEEASNNKSTEDAEPRRSEDRGDTGHWDKTGQKNDNTEETEEKHFIKEAEKTK